MEPDPDWLERLDGFMEATPDEQNLLLKKVLRRVSVGTEEITVEPWRGNTWVWSRVTGEWTA
jgi:hypothetical protein